MRKTRRLLGRKKKGKKKLIRPQSTQNAVVLSPSPPYVAPNKIHPQLQPATDLLKTAMLSSVTLSLARIKISAFSVTSSRAAFRPRTFLRNSFTGRKQPTHAQ